MGDCAQDTDFRRGVWNITQAQWRDGACPVCPQVSVNCLMGRSEARDKPQKRARRLEAEASYHQHLTNRCDIAPPHHKERRAKVVTADEVSLHMWQLPSSELGLDRVVACCGGRTGRHLSRRCERSDRWVPWCTADFGSQALCRGTRSRMPKY